MKQEDNQLLLQDLCARLPYGVICEILFVKEELKADYIKYLQKDTTFQIKPYLRPMSSMTEEERKEYWDITSVSNHCAAIDWLNAHHFDYRGLIEKGLALESPEGMYKY